MTVNKHTAMAIWISFALLPGTQGCSSDPSCEKLRAVPWAERTTEVQAAIDACYEKKCGEILNKDLSAFTDDDETKLVQCLEEAEH